MCRYCKKLKEIKDLDEKSYEKILSEWKQRDRKARLLLAKCLMVLADVKFSFLSFGCAFDSFDDQVLFKQISDFLHTDWIGK